jgi:hypothetical protein
MIAAFVVKTLQLVAIIVLLHRVGLPRMLGFIILLFVCVLFLQINAREAQRCDSPFVEFFPKEPLC